MVSESDQTRSNATGERHASGGGDIVGIDLGTTNSLVAILTEAGPRVLGRGPVGAMVPSVVRYARSTGSDGGATGALVVEAVGDEARATRDRFPDRTVASAKRLMGRSAAETRSFAMGFSVPLVEGP
ncbi:MAG: Hsp70 family protein, partial [Planctomycetaceae bacterium]|nr:Hsp70 family protein [Planctomycetaceae bacterium]